MSRAGVCAPKGAWEMFSVQGPQQQRTAFILWRHLHRDSSVSTLRGEPGPWYTLSPSKRAGFVHFYTGRDRRSLAGDLPMATQQESRGMGGTQ